MRRMKNKEIANKISEAEEILSHLSVELVGKGFGYSKSSDAVIEAMSKLESAREDIERKLPWN